MQIQRKLVMVTLAALTTVAIILAVRALSAAKASVAYIEQPAVLRTLYSRGAGVTEQTFESPSPQSARRISQEQIFNLPQIGRLRVRAFEPLGDGPEFEFTNLMTGKDELNEFFSEPYCGGNDESKSKFIVIRNRRLPSPLVISIVLSPGGSDSGWEATAAGVVDSQLQELTYERLRTSDEGGVFFGDLGHGIGPGAAQWDFVWGEDEAHVSAHQYQITLYKWNGRRFEWYRVFRTGSRFYSGRAALRANGLHYVDIRKSFPGWSDIDTW